MSNSGASAAFKSLSAGDSNPSSFASESSFIPNGPRTSWLSLCKISLDPLFDDDADANCCGCFNPLRRNLGAL